MVSRIEIAPVGPVTLYEEDYPMPSLEEMRARIQAIVDAEQRGLPAISSDNILPPPEAIEPHENRRAAPEGEIVRKLQPRSQENSVTYTCYGVSFDVKQVLRGVCPRIFESLCSQGGEMEEDQEHKLPAMFARIGKEFTQIGKELSKPFHANSSEAHEEKDEPYEPARERDHYLGVPATKAANVLGFLEQPWSQMMPNVPILTPKDVKYLMEHWQTFSQRYMIKLKWMELVRAPSFVPVNPRMLLVDDIRLTDDDRQRLLPYCLEFWNKPEVNYRWKLGLKHTDEVVPLWKTRMVGSSLSFLSEQSVHPIS